MATAAVDEHRLDPMVATEVATCFLSARSTTRDPVVVAAYRELQRQSDQMFTDLTMPASAAGLRVEFTWSLAPYASDQEMIGAVRASRLLEVTVAATEQDRLHPLLGSEPGGPYDRFRAVHDIVGHVRARLGFDRDGEYAAWRLQDQLYRGLARWALASELHGEHSVRWTTGEVSDHRATLIDPGLLRRARRGYARPEDVHRRAEGGSSGRLARGEPPARFGRLPSRGRRPRGARSGLRL